MIIVLCPCIEATDFKFKSSNHHQAAGMRVLVIMGEQQAPWLPASDLRQFAGIEQQHMHLLMDFRQFAAIELQCVIDLLGSSAQLRVSG